MKARVPREAYRIALAAWADMPTLQHVLDELVAEGWIGPVPLQWAGWVRSDLTSHTPPYTKSAEVAEVPIANTGVYVSGEGWQPGTPPWVTS